MERFVFARKYSMIFQAPQTLKLTVILVELQAKLPHDVYDWVYFYQQMWLNFIPEITVHLQ